VDELAALLTEQWQAGVMPRETIVLAGRMG